MHKKYLTFLCIITLLTFFNCLFNNFVGDDEFLFIKNPYYHSLKNLPKIFTRDYITDQDAIFNDIDEGINSGSVAYRPVLSATFFIDYRLWGQKAFGYHLTNVLIHLINTILLYLLFFLILKDRLTAFVAAALFAVHPLKSEAVCSIGYRADSLAALFLLSSFLSYVKSKEKGGRWHIGTHLFFLLALFTKESAVIYPALLMGYDWLIEKRNFAHVLKDLFSRYAGFILILVFYLFVYVMVFPNSSLHNAKPLSAGGVNHVLTIVYIFSHYLTVFFLPFLVKSLPPLYAPPIEALSTMEIALAFLVAGGFMMVLAIAARRDKTLLFFLLWFLICFIPVSNIIVIVNPMAYRFMYLPSIGLAALTGILLMRLKNNRPLFKSNGKIFTIILTGILLVCMITTGFLNFSWRDNIMMALAMVKDFPEYPVGYLHAGIAYYDAGSLGKAKSLLEEGVERGLMDPRGYYLLGLCYLNEPERSRAYFEKSIDIFPKFIYSYIALGRHYMLQNDYENALNYLYASINISPRWNAFGYLIQTYMLKGEPAEAEHILEESQRMLPQAHAGSVKKFYEDAQKGTFQLPVDLGI